MSDSHVAEIGDYIVKIERENTELRSRIAELEGARAKDAAKLEAHLDVERAATRELLNRLDAAADRARGTGEAQELERLRAFRVNVQRVASDIGCEGWDKVGRCDCPGCRIWKADWDDDVIAAQPSGEGTGR